MDLVFSLRFLFLDSLVNVVLIRALVMREWFYVERATWSMNPSRVAFTFLLAAAAIVLQILV
jgi:hypothetical protein